MINPGQKYGLHKEIQNYLDKIDALRIDHKKLADEIASLRGEHQSMQLEMGEMIKNKVQLGKEIVEALDDHISKLEPMASGLKTEIETGIETKKRLFEEKVGLDKDLIDLKIQKEKLMKENADYKASLDQYKHNLDIYAERLNEHYKNLNTRIKLYGENR